METKILGYWIENGSTYPRVTTGKYLKGVKNPVIVNDAMPDGATPLTPAQYKKALADHESVNLKRQIAQGTPQATIDLFRSKVKAGEISEDAMKFLLGGS